MKKPHKILVAITGASGMVFLRSFLQMLSTTDITVHAVCSDAAKEVLKLELETTPAQLSGIKRWFKIKDFTAAPASGSSNYDAMIILPCTMGTLAAVANGVVNNLIHRAADVMLKEKKPLILAVRETPFNRIHLQNMLAVNDAGGIICPPLPSYYLKPTSIEAAADTFSWRLADQIGLVIKDRQRWDNV
jgi:4-hydroxy-3-polyprenylbenzoate decarboxylase